MSIIIINPGLDSRARTALEHMLESVVRARGKVLRTNFSATSRVTRATKLTQAACPFHKLELREISELPATRMLGSSSCRTFRGSAAALLRGIGVSWREVP